MLCNFSEHIPANSCSNTAEWCDFTLLLRIYLHGWLFENNSLSLLGRLDHLLHAWVAQNACSFLVWNVEVGSSVGSHFLASHHWLRVAHLGWSSSILRIGVLDALRIHVLLVHSNILELLLVHVFLIRLLSACFNWLEETRFDIIKWSWFSLRLWFHIFALGSLLLEIFRSSVHSLHILIVINGLLNDSLFQLSCVSVLHLSIDLVLVALHDHLSGATHVLSIAKSLLVSDQEPIILLPLFLEVNPLLLDLSRSNLLTELDYLDMINAILNQLFVLLDHLQLLGVEIVELLLLCFE